MINFHILRKEFNILLILLKNVISNISADVFLVSLGINDIGSSFKVGGDTDKSNYHTVSIFISVSRISKDILFDKLHYFL